MLPAFASPDGRADAIIDPVGGSASNWRWVAAMVATVGVVAVVVGVFLLASPRIGAPSFVAHYVPADAAAYAEVHLDLPGDQRDRLASFMSHFPGFADPAAFQQKIDEALQQALQSRNAGFDWKNDVEPWFGGQIGISSQTVTSTVGTPPSMVIALSVKDRPKLDALVSSRRASVEAREQVYKNQTIWTVTSTSANGKLVSFTVTDDVLLVGTRLEDVEKALDVKAGDVPSLADDAFVTQQFGTFHADRLAAFYYDHAPSMGSIPSQLVALPAGCLSYINDLGDIKYVGELRAETDHLASIRGCATRRVAPSRRCPPTRARPWRRPHRQTQSRTSRCASWAPTSGGSSAWQWIAWTRPAQGSTPGRSNSYSGLPHRTSSTSSSTAPWS